MELFEQLAMRVQQAATEIAKLKKDNKQLLSEVELLREEVQKQPALKRETEEFRRERERLRSKLERLHSKLDKACFSDLPVKLPIDDGIYEKSN